MGVRRRVGGPTTVVDRVTTEPDPQSPLRAAAVKVADTVRTAATTTVQTTGLADSGADFGVNERRIIRAQRFANALFAHCGSSARLDVTGVNDWKTQRFVRMFQDTYQLGDYADDGELGGLVVDGLPGGKTEPAMDHCEANGFKVSAHFNYRELRTNGDQTLSTGNHVVFAVRELITACERLRAILIRDGQITDAQGLTFESLYRSWLRNSAIGGAIRSQHPQGKAVDMRAALRVTPEQLVEAGFTGHGYWGKSKARRIMLHGDVRSIGRVRLTVASAIKWFYTNL